MGSPAAQQAFQSACAKLNVIELGNEFSTLDAGEQDCWRRSKPGSKRIQH